MAMTESAFVTARPAPFGAITVYKVISSVSAPFGRTRTIDMANMSPAIREDLGVTLRDVDPHKSSLLSRAIQWVRDQHVRRQTMAQLSALSDRQLEDIGMSRADVAKL